VRKTLIVATATLLAGSIPALAIFGFGDIVFDPSSYGELVSQLAQMEKQYSELVSTYQMVTNQYNQMVRNAKMITSKARWKAVLSPWAFPSATNTYGSTDGWVSAVNSGARALNGYLQAVTRLQTYSPVWSSLNASQQDFIARNYATVELSDGITVNSLNQLGQIRGHASTVETAIDTLENDSLSDDPDANTEVGVLNKINASGIIADRNSQDTNKLLASLLDHQMIEAKSRRDSEVQSINNDIALQQNAPAIDAQHLTGATAVLTSYRLP